MTGYVTIPELDTTQHNNVLRVDTQILRLLVSANTGHAHRDSVEWKPVAEKMRSHISLINCERNECRPAGIGQNVTTKWQLNDWCDAIKSERENPLHERPHQEGNKQFQWINSAAKQFRACNSTACYMAIMKFIRTNVSSRLWITFMRACERARSHFITNNLSIYLQCAHALIQR